MATGFPLWHVIYMSTLKTINQDAAIKISQGFTGKMYSFGGHFTNNSQYIISISKGGFDFIDEVILKFDVSNNTNPLFIQKLSCPSCTQGSYARSVLIQNSIFFVVCVRTLGWACFLSLIDSLNGNF